MAPASVLRRASVAPALATASTCGERASSASGIGAATGISPLNELGRERVFLEDLRIAPAPGPIELGDDDPAAFEEDLEDAVLVRVELDQPAVALEADGVERVEDAAWRQVGVGGRSAGRV